MRLPWIDYCLFLSYLGCFCFAVDFEIGLLDRSWVIAGDLGEFVIILVHGEVKTVVNSGKTSFKQTIYQITVSTPEGEREIVWVWDILLQTIWRWHSWLVAAKDDSLHPSWSFRIAELRSLIVKSFEKSLHSLTLGAWALVTNLPISQWSRMMRCLSSTMTTSHQRGKMVRPPSK